MSPFSESVYGFALLHEEDMSKRLKKRSDEAAKPKKVPKTNEGTDFDISHFEFRGDEGGVRFNIIEDIGYYDIWIVERSKLFHCRLFALGC